MIAAPEGFPEALLESEGRIVFFPVRHHSPTAAHLVRELITRRRPAAVLVEGPAEYNHLLHEFALSHELPIAIFTSATMADGARLRAFYPFCVYSPEWQAITAARESGATARFIDLSLPEIHSAEAGVLPENAYADAQLAEPRYQRALCARLGVPDIHALWDLMVEVEEGIPLAEYLRRVHYYCYALRLSAHDDSPGNAAREATMARHILDALVEFPSGTIIVVTGGFHSHGLYRLITGKAEEVPPPPPPARTIARFVSLTPYSYRRLDGLTGYDSGMPSPGFYHHVWEKPHEPIAPLLAEVIGGLRERRLRISTADLIAATTMAEGLARLRGHARVWRRDLLDGLRSALLKDSIADASHPFIAAVLDFFRGDRVGRVASGTQLPALAIEIERIFQSFGVSDVNQQRIVRADLLVPAHRHHSVLLHRLAALEIPGVTYLRGPDFAARTSLESLEEEWQVAWSPEAAGASVEASAYGTTLEEAARAKISESLVDSGDAPSKASRLLIRAALAGLADLGPFLRDLVRSRLVTAREFSDVCTAAGDLHYLYCYDESLGTAGSGDYGALLGEAWNRGLWLSQSLGSDDTAPATLKGFALLQEILRRSAGACGIERAAAADTFSRVATDAEKSPEVRGACTGILWGIDAVPSEQVLRDARFFGSPETIGRWLHGLFATARETALRLPEMLRLLDQTVVDWDDHEFLVAAPSLRLAFTPFTPREKIELAERLLAQGGDAPSSAINLLLEASAEDIIQVRSVEVEVLAMMARYGIRGGVA